MDSLSQYSEAQLAKYLHRIGDGDLDTFLSKCKPSIIETSDSPWIWIINDLKQPHNESEAVTVHRGAEIPRLEEIETDERIPVRAKKGQESKKVVRERAQAEAVAALKRTAVEGSFTHGKWLLYPSHESVDAVWPRIARSIANGPLRDAGAYEAKVATTENPENSHVICVYYDDVYDKDRTEKVLLALLNHGLEPSAVKPDLYTLIGLDSKHPAKLRSSVWRPVDFMPKDDLKALTASWNKDKEASFYTDRKPDTKPQALSTKDKNTVAAAKSPDKAPKPHPKRSISPGSPAKLPTDDFKSPAKRAKNQADNDIFASDDDEDE